MRSAGLEPALSTSSTWPGCRWTTSAWSRHPVPTRITSLTKARPQPCVTARAAKAVLPGQVSNLHCGGQSPVACQLADPALRAEGATRTRGTRVGKQGLEPRQSWSQTRRAYPYATSREVEMAGIEPAAATLAGRARSLAVTPTGRLPRGRFGLPLSCSHYGRVKKSSLHERPAGTAGVEPAFFRFWGPAAYPLAHP